jgi:Lon protease-like protein
MTEENIEGTEAGELSPEKAKKAEAVAELSDMKERIERLIVWLTEDLTEEDLRRAKEKIRDARDVRP